MLNRDRGKSVRHHCEHLVTDSNCLFIFPRVYCLTSLLSGIKLSSRNRAISTKIVVHRNHFNTPAFNRRTYA